MRGAFKSIDPSAFIGWKYKCLDFMSNTLTKKGLSAIERVTPNIISVSTNLVRVQISLLPTGILYE